MRERIIEAATAQFVRSGYDGVSMQRIADELGLTKAALYYHFAGKADLLAAVFASYLDQVGAVVTASVGTAAADARLRQIVHGLFALPADRRAIMRLAMHDVGRLDAAHRAAFGATYRERFLDPLQQVFADGITAGILTRRRPDLLVTLLLGILYPLFRPPSAGVPDATVADVDDLLDVFLLGALARPAD